MTVQTLTCPECGRVGKVTGRWVKPGVADGDLMEGLDPLACDGCRTVLNSHGYAVVAIQRRGDGTVEIKAA